MEGWTDVRTDVHDVMAIKPNFLASMGYNIFLTMVLRSANTIVVCRSKGEFSLRRHVNFLFSQFSTIMRFCAL